MYRTGKIVFEYGIARFSELTDDFNRIVAFDLWCSIFALVSYFRKLHCADLSRNYNECPDQPIVWVKICHV